MTPASSTVGTYYITIVDDDGTPTATLERTTMSGRPTVGECVEVDDVLYRVTSVVHEPENVRCSRVYSVPRLIVQLATRQGMQ